MMTIDTIIYILKYQTFQSADLYDTCNGNHIKGIAYDTPLPNILPIITKWNSFHNQNTNVLI